ncbi:MOSC N-terminal beta barrel domain-containing protein [uncultured Roseobacter sp.]|uniref:MOSC domain-containing protein n=1 Tax=uncultured Roseobacter sp. TaxID=114847 RepID=UPI0026233C5C|nr:MOSC N-terminal beta barrel domain-containing protein [uncultured Roseobacter sp.]
MTRLTTLLRYPLKAHGRERIPDVVLRAAESMPWDRLWAVTHEASRPGDGWVSCSNFTRAAGSPELMAITAQLSDDGSSLTLRHPRLPDLTFQPDNQQDVFLVWVAPLMPAGRAAPTGILRLDGRGFTDSDFPSVSLTSHASHRAVEETLGQELSLHRWRSNMWLDGLEAWRETDLVGKDVALGEAVLHIREQITRCRATTANPETGQRDADTLGALDSLGHQEFGVCAEVVRGGLVREGDLLEVL